MSMNRRGFLAGIIAAGIAPAIIRTPGLIMPIKPSLGGKWEGFYPPKVPHVIDIDTAYGFSAEYTILGIDAYGNSVVEKIKIDEASRNEFKAITGITFGYEEGDDVVIS